MIQTSLHRRPAQDGLYPIHHAAADMATVDRDCGAVVAAFERHGGLASCETLMEYLRPVEMQPLSRVARWIVARHIVTLRWQGQTLVPLFQFIPRCWQVRPIVGRVLQELGEAYDDQELAFWFSAPNGWLCGRLPLACLEGSTAELLQAARADRFIMRG